MYCAVIRESISLSLGYLSGLIFINLFISCSKSNDNPTNTIQQQIENDALLNTWRITYFNNFGNDETNHFA
jgi:hypothetical protein